VTTQQRFPPAPQKIFVLMLENRSFDHMLGFSDISGTDAVTAARTTIDGLVGRHGVNTDPAVKRAVVASTPADFVITLADKDPCHEFVNVVEQLCGPGAVYRPQDGYPPIDNSGFVSSYRRTGTARPEKIMRCFAPAQLPVLNALAREFAVCDRWFSALPGPTWPNRLFVHAASSGGLDDSPSNWDTVAGYLLDGYHFDNGTIFDRLSDNHIAWEVVAGDEFPQVLALRGMGLNLLAGRFSSAATFSERLHDPEYRPRYVFIEPDYGDVLFGARDFRGGNSQHPLADVTNGERLVKTVYEAIRNSPHWERSVLIITYDEHGGFYDHVAPPPAVPPGDRISFPHNNHHDFTFDRLGGRVPAVVISPLIPRGTIDHTVYDHSSVLATVARLFGLPPLTHRDAAANDLLQLLTLPEPRRDTPATLPDPADSGISEPRDVIHAMTPPAVTDAEHPPAFWGAFAVSIRRHLTVAPAEHHQHIRQRASQVRDPTEALPLIAQARAAVRAQ
jgi:phospholipase C